MPGAATLATFAGISLLLAVTPGPDMAVVTRSALVHGRRGVFLTTGGNALALLLWVFATAVGVAALLRTSALLFSVVKVVGAAYLVYLGVRAWWGSRRVAAAASSAPLTSAEFRPISQFRIGFVSASTNPKLGVFFVTFLPQFVNRDSPALIQLLVLGGLFALVGWTWMNIYGLAVTRLRAIITAPSVRRWMDRVTGTVLIGLGLRLALDRA